MPPMHITQIIKSSGPVSLAELCVMAYLFLRACQKSNHKNPSIKASQIIKMLMALRICSLFIASPAAARCQVGLLLHTSLQRCRVYRGGIHLPAVDIACDA